jgi:bacterioferritin
MQPVTKVSPELLAKMNQGIAQEIAASIQYMMQHIQVVGVKGVAVQDEFKGVAVAEMKHAEAIADRLWYLGATPTVKVDPVNVGVSLKDFLENDRKAEEKSIALYREIIDMADKEKDQTTAFMFREILKAEEDHHDLFITMLEEV